MRFRDGITADVATDRMSAAEAARQLVQLLGEVQGSENLVAVHDLGPTLRKQRETGLLRDLRCHVLVALCAVHQCDVRETAALLTMLGMDADRQAAWWDGTWGSYSAEGPLGVA
jgi:hypothetical protein